MKVLNFGSLNIDHVYHVDHMVEAGETLNSQEMSTFCGGKGLNQSVALAKAGVEVYHAGRVGEEGGILLDMLKHSGVNTEYVETDAEKSGHTIIQVDGAGQNCILLYGGANRSMTKDYIDRVLADFSAGDVILLQNEINLLDYVIDSAFEKGMTIVLNPSPYDDNLKPCDFGKVSLFLVNEIEAGQMTGYEKPEEILAELKIRYPKARVVLTLGAEGSIYQDEKRRCKAEARKVQAVDTTAAGDTFTGYFIASMIEDLSPEEGLALATKASAIAVTRKGAAPSIPLREEVEREVEK